MIGALSVLRWAWPYLLVASISAGAAWWLQATSYGAKIDRMERNWAEQMRDQADAARAEQSRLIETHNQQLSKFQVADAEFTARMKEKSDEVEKLKSDVADGRRRLYIAVKRASSGNQSPQSAANPGAPAGERAELDRSATDTYFQLHAGIERLEAKYKQCVDLLKADRLP